MIDIPRLESELNRFSAYIQYRNAEKTGSYGGFITFRDKGLFPGSEEEFKAGIEEKAQAKLRFNEWDESWIEDRRIHECVSRAIDSTLVDRYQLQEFNNRFDLHHKDFRPEAERVLYDIYCGRDDETAFSEAIDVFGAKYDLISYLFYMKRPDEYLPVRSRNFDESFAMLGIDYRTARRCSWENYCGFLSIMQEIQKQMENTLFLKEGEAVRLIDAHSFLWIIHESDYKKWEPTVETEINIEWQNEHAPELSIHGSGKKKTVTSKAFDRSRRVIKATKDRANGACELCHCKAPFNDKKGMPYLEVHHVEWLSHGGRDSTDNTVALCPNCHTKMHVVDDPEDVKALKACCNKKRVE